MAELADWKSKYIEAIREMELHEKQWHALEKVLRRLVARLCAAATGVDDRLDLQLSAVAKAARADTGAPELQALSDSLSEAVLALEQTGTLHVAHTPTKAPPSVGIRSASTPVAPQAPPANRHVPPPAPALTASIAAVHGLLEQLAALDGGGGHAAACATQLAVATTDAVLARVLDQVADLVRARGEALATDRREAAAMLGQATERLGEMASFLAGTDDDYSENHAAVESLNSQVLREVADLSARARSINDLAPLRALVAERLEAVASRVREFRAHQEERFTANVSRIERLRARITELETETTTLHRGLATERRNARTDVLTGVANRGSFDERLSEEIERRKRFRSAVSLVVWDIDLFKRINDDYGHRAGDAVLREVARALAARKRATDHLARYGGEEFVLLLIGTPVREALAVAEQLRDAVAALKFGFRGTPVRITISCGLTELRDDDDPQTAFDRADAALYRAKAAGRNRCIAD